MTTSTTVLSANPISAACGQEIGEKILAAFAGQKPDAVIVFASSRYQHAELLQAIDNVCHPGVMVGCSSAGEFTARISEQGSVSVLALKSTDIVFRATLGRGLRADRAAAAEEMVGSFRGMSSHDFPFRGALVLTDALAGHADDFVEKLTLLTAGRYQLFGGGAGDDANFTRTHVFFGTEPVPDAAVALEMLSQKPIGVGIRHTWEPGSERMRVTEADGMKLITINNLPAAEVFQAHANLTGQALDRESPLAFFLHNVVGIVTPAGFRLRVPLAILEDGSVQCAADVPVGSLVHIMVPKGGSALAATRTALDQLGEHEPGAALFFDCVATRLRMGRDFGFELESVRKELGEDVDYAGCNTYGQIARAEGQFSGFHNCTAVVAILPK